MLQLSSRTWVVQVWSKMRWFHKENSRWNPGQLLSKFCSIWHALIALIPAPSLHFKLFASTVVAQVQIWLSLSNIVRVMWQLPKIFPTSQIIKRSNCFHLQILQTWIKSCKLTWINFGSSWINFGSSYLHKKLKVSTMTSISSPFCNLDSWESTSSHSRTANISGLSGLQMLQKRDTKHTQNTEH